ncbi:MAG TPA: hypothetical protein VM925_17420 [Labilithrix sp.]|nr:hypothetical protein [Labilithrix sp.]
MNDEAASVAEEAEEDTLIDACATIRPIKLPVARNRAPKRRPITTAQLAQIQPRARAADGAGGLGGEFDHRTRLPLPPSDVPRDVRIDAYDVFDGKKQPLHEGRALAVTSCPRSAGVTVA